MKKECLTIIAFTLVLLSGFQAASQPQHQTEVDCPPPVIICPAPVLMCLLPGYTTVEYSVINTGGDFVPCSFIVHVINIANPNGGDDQNLYNILTATLIGIPPTLPTGITIVSVNWSYLPPSIPAGAPAPTLNPPGGVSNINVFFNTVSPPPFDYKYTFLYEVVYTDGVATCQASDLVTITNYRSSSPPNPAVPLSNWSLFLAIGLMLVVSIFIYRRKISG
jgi:hypothetical protein